MCFCWLFYKQKMVVLKVFLRHTCSALIYILMPHLCMIRNCWGCGQHYFIIVNSFHIKETDISSFLLQVQREREQGLAWGVIKERNIFNVGYSCSIKGRNQLASDANSTRDWRHILMPLHLNVVCNNHSVALTFS